MCLGLHAQTSSSGGAGIWDANHFLWFTGHWSKAGNKRTFVIDKGGGSATGGTSAPGDPPGNPPAGGTITFNPDGSVNMSNGNVDAWNKKMDEALGDEQKYLKGLQNPGDNLDPAIHHLNQLLIPDAEQRVQDIKGYKIDPSADMLGGGDNSSPHAPARSLADAVADGCKNIKPDYDEVMNYYNTQVKGHTNDLKYPPPPVTDYDCYSCDSNLRKQYDTTNRNYARDFAKEEVAIAKKGFGLLHELALVGVNTNMVSKSGSCSFIDVWALSEATYGIAHHVNMRAEKMMYDNKENYKAAPAIIRTFLQVHRAWCLISGQDDDASILPVLSNLIGKSVTEYVDKLKKNDWRQISNIPLMLSIVRDAALMGGKSSDVSDQFYLSLANIVNGFKMTVDMDIKIGVKDGYKLAHLKGECHVIPAFQDDEKQCYKWVVADENRTTVSFDGHGWYIAKQLQNFDATLLAAQVVAPGPMPKYTGTKKYTVHLASLAMDFCHPGNDTINLTGFTANPPETGTWVWPNGAVTQEGQMGMEQYFEDINNKKKFADDGEAKKAKDVLKSQADQLRVQMEALKAQMTAPQGNTPPGSAYEKMMEFKQQAMARVAAPVMAKMVYLYFLLPVENNSAQLVKAEFDAKKINPQEVNAIIYGYYRINIINEANGKIK